MSRASVVALLSVLALVVTTQARQQIILNGSFENTVPDEEDPNIILVDQWNSFQGLHSMDFAFEGDWSALGDKDQGSFCGYAQRTPIEVTGDTRMYMQAFVYNPSAFALAGTEAAGIKIQFRPPEGLVLPPPEENLAFDANAPVDSWELVSYTTVVPADVFIAEIVFLSFDNSDTNGPVYCDDVSAELNSGSNQLINDSFEIGINANDGMPFWDEFGSETATARKNNGEVPAKAGAFVCKMDGNTTGVIQPIPVAPGDSLYIEGFFRQRSANPYSDPNAFAGPKVQWDAGSIPPQVDIRAGNGNPASGVNNIIEPGAPTDQWVKVFIDYTMPSDAAAALSGTVINGFAPPAGQSSRVYFDAVEFVLTNIFTGSDSDADSDQDIADIALLQRVFTGPVGPNVYGGLVFDHDEDDDVDWDDIGANVFPNMTNPVVIVPEEE
jgi:hypothetical protein